MLGLMWISVAALVVSAASLAASIAISSWRNRKAGLSADYVVVPTTNRKHPSETQLVITNHGSAAARDVDLELFDTAGEPATHPILRNT